MYKEQYNIISNYLEKIIEDDNLTDIMLPTIFCQKAESIKYIYFRNARELKRMTLGRLLDNIKNEIEDEDYWKLMYFKQIRNKLSHDMLYVSKMGEKDYDTLASDIEDLENIINKLFKAYYPEEKG